jgi:hypothetical protein
MTLSNLDAAGIRHPEYCLFLPSAGPLLLGFPKSLGEHAFKADTLADESCSHFLAMRLQMLLAAASHMDK